MNLAAVVVGYAILAVIGLSTVLCLLALAVNFAQELVADLRPHRRGAVVLPLPVQRPTNVRVLHETDAS